MEGYRICHTNGRVAMPWTGQLAAALSLLRRRFNYKPMWDMWPGFSWSTSVFAW